MKLLIDSLTATTGWGVPAGSPAPAIYGLNEISDFIAGVNTASLIFKFNTGCLKKYVTKTFNVDVSAYTELVLYIWSRNKKASSFEQASDYYYKIKLASSGAEYYIQTKNQLNYIVLDISSLTTLTEITITALHNDEDYLIASSVYAIKDEFPYDIFTAIKEQLETDITATLSDGINIGTVTASAGDTEITIDSYVGFIDRYSVIKIKDLSNNETHQVQEIANGVCRLGTLFDGKLLLNNYSGATVYLQIPVNFGNYEREIMLPSISVWGMTPEFVLRGAKLENVTDSYNLATGSTSRREGMLLKYNMLIDCEAREGEIVAICSQIVRNFIGREKLWLNNRKIDVKFEGTPTEIEPTEAFDIIPKIQYECSVEFKEELWSRVNNPLITNTTIQVTPMSQ